MLSSNDRNKNTILAKRNEVKDDEMKQTKTIRDFYRRPHSARDLPSTTTASDGTLFFQEQNDMVSEILLFLDSRSLLTMCNTTKKAASLLRDYHVLSSASENNHSNHQNKNACIILDKLDTVYDLKQPQEDATTITAKLWKLPKPSPLRLLQLVNGNKCERCHRSLLSPCVLAGSGDSGPRTRRLVLPSLSFGIFCCTLCLFDRKP